MFPRVWTGIVWALGFLIERTDACVVVMEAEPAKPEARSALSSVYFRLHAELCGVSAAGF